MRPASLAGRTIVIDAGHGSLQPGDWTDPGAIGPTGLKERDVVLDIAWRVSEKLLAEGATVIMTRTGDTNLTLPERSAVANNNGADMLVSIHANASPTSSIAGTSTYYHAPWGTEWETQVETRKRLARSIQAELLQKLQRQDQGVREANFSVLRNSMVPSVLVETAFISNPEEERVLADPTFRDLAAEGIVSGIKRYVVSQ
ncbi:hypothetical protein SY88_06120 [Clostridiales bacterium PH28_bin88]|nr:hypothetical protein SY88_06120 [Clostridiales bacterium PH28_bin88]